MWRLPFGVGEDPVRTFAGSSRPLDESHSDEERWKQQMCGTVRVAS